MYIYSHTLVPCGIVEASVNEEFLHPHVDVTFQRGISWNILGSLNQIVQLLFACIICVGFMHKSETFVCIFTERAKERVKNVVEMYGMQGVQNLMAQMYALIFLYSWV